MFRIPPAGPKTHRAYLIDPAFEGVTPVAFADGPDLVYEAGLHAMPGVVAGKVGEDVFLRTKDAEDYGVELVDSGLRLRGAFLMLGFRDGEPVSASLPLWELHEKIRPFVDPVPSMEAFFRSRHAEAERFLEIRRDRGFRVVRKERLVSALRALDTEHARRAMQIFRHGLREGGVTIGAALGDVVDVIADYAATARAKKQKASG